MAELACIALEVAMPRPLIISYPFARQVPKPIPETKQSRKDGNITARKRYSYGSSSSDRDIEWSTWRVCMKHSGGRA